MDEGGALIPISLEVLLARLLPEADRLRLRFQQATRHARDDAATEELRAIAQRVLAIGDELANLGVGREGPLASDLHFLQRFVEGDEQQLRARLERALKTLLAWLRDPLDPPPPGPGPVAGVASLGRRRR